MAQKYKSLNGKYLEDAEALLEKGDYPQASEKLWGAVATAIKAVATARRWRHYSHRDLRVAMDRLFKETGDDDFNDLFDAAESLHANFYEDFASAEGVRFRADKARRLIEKLKALTQ